LEEAYELCGAIDSGDADNLREELGDVMLQVIFHASLARDEGLFDLNDVSDAACKKLIYRHPHVFGDVNVSGSDEVLVNWDLLKEKEKEQRCLSQVMEGVTEALPALWRAEKCQKKAEKAGQPIFAPGAAATALQTGAAALASAEDAETALGELLFAAVAVARERGVDAERALHAACPRAIDAVKEREGQ
ncbi:MAG: MazG family protein, partial [Oscillospiraceae bacterium]|nr:MazG family protein [Oscillospiraceae bacterium]